MRNLIKLFYLIILFALFPARLMATPQLGEDIYINGKMYKMLSYPSETDSIISEILKKIKPTNAIVRYTFLWRGYTGYWSIQHNNLYLDSLIYDIQDPVSKEYLTKTIIPKNESAFSAYKDNIGIKASWYTGKLRLIEGKVIRYDYMEGNTFEKESFLTVKKGTVTGSKRYKNKLFCKNELAHAYVYEAFNDAFIKEFPNTESFPVTVSYSKINAKGIPTEVEIEFKDITENKEKIYNFIRSYLLKNHILGVYRINNKLTYEKSYIWLGNKRNKTSYY